MRDAVRNTKRRRGRRAPTQDPSTNHLLSRSCFDLLLEALEQDLSSTYLVGLIKAFMPSTQCVADLMGFKFRLYQGGEKKVPAASPRGRKIAAPKERERTPSSLFRLASLLMRLGYLRLEDVYVHRAPGPSRAKSASRSLRRALLIPQANTGSLYRCAQST